MRSVSFMRPKVRWYLQFTFIYHDGELRLQMSLFNQVWLNDEEDEEDCFKTVRERMVKAERERGGEGGGRGDLLLQNCLVRGDGEGREGEELP